MQNILDKLDLKKEKRLFREILKLHGLLKCKREEEYISALQYILDRGVSYKINDYVSNATDVYLKSKKISYPQKNYDEN